MFGISKLVMVEELTLAIRILKKWDEKIDAGVPGSDVPAADYDVDAFRREMAAELLLISSKLESVATIMLDSDNQ